MITSIEEILLEINLWLQLYWRDILHFPWHIVAIIWPVLFLVCGYFIKPVSLTAETRVTKKNQPAILLTAGLFLALIYGIFYLLIPMVVKVFMLLYILPLIVGLLAGSFHYLARKKNQILKNSVSIFSGNFYIDPNQSFFGAVWQAIRKQVWEQPQILIGQGFAQILNSLGLISDVFHTEGITIVQGIIPFANGVSFGPYVLVTTKYSGTETRYDISDKSSFMNILIRHEMGHSIQSRHSGPLYLYKYGIPSAMSQGWTEKDAEFRSDKYFLKNFGIAPAFVSYEKTHKPSETGILAYLIMMLTLIGGSISGATPGFIGGYLFTSGLIALFNLGKKHNPLL